MHLIKLTTFFFRYMWVARARYRDNLSEFLTRPTISGYVVISLELCLSVSLFTRAYIKKHHNLNIKNANRAYRLKSCAISRYIARFTPDGES